MKDDSVKHPQAAAEFLKDRAQAKWHDSAIWWVRQKRDAQAKQLPEWEELRRLAREIKAHTLSQLDDYLAQFEANAQKTASPYTGLPMPTSTTASCTAFWRRDR
jgi:L-lactate dehydrogenase complex protein LldF